MSILVDPRTAHEITIRNRRLLKEMGISAPPLRMEDVFTHLKIHRSYYDLEDPSLLDEVLHRLRIGGRRFKDLITKSKLHGLFFPDSNKVMVDEAVPNSKRKWIEAHEAQHQLNPNHRFLLGDTAETLDPDYQEMIEAEANYGASSMIFLCEAFTTEAVEYPIAFRSVQSLATRFKNSMTSTLRRYVQCSHQIPLAGMVSTPSWIRVADGRPERWRHYFASRQFVERFPGVYAHQMLAAIDRIASPCRGGPAGVGHVCLNDANSLEHLFTLETFFNRHDLLTLVSYLRPSSELVVVP